MKRKFCVLLLAFVLLSSFFTFDIYAAATVPDSGTLKIRSWDFSDSFDASENSQIAKASNSGGALVALNTHDSISYDVNAKSEGIYLLTMAMANTEGSTAVERFDISVNGDPVQKAKNTAGKGWNVPVENTVGVITLPEGESTITFTSTSSSAYFFYFKLTRLLGSDLGDVTLGDNSGIYGQAGYLTFSENSRAYFDLKDHVSGFYKIEFTAKSNEKSSLNISVSEETREIAEINSGVFYNTAVYTYLDETDTQLEITGLKGNIDFTQIKIYLLCDGDRALLAEFCEAVNNAESEEEIKSAVSKAKCVLHPDGIYPDDILFSMKSVYLSMLEASDRSQNAMLSTYFKSVGEEINNPKISLYVDSVKTNELKSGDLSVSIDGGAFAIKSAIAAIYEENRLKYVDLCSVCEDGYLKAEIENAVLDEAKANRIEILFFDGLLNISPTDIKVFKEFYVDISGNDETGDGSAEAPFATIEKAKEAVEEISHQMTGDIYVNINAGEYFIPKTLVFDENSGGKNGFNVIYRGVGGKAEISGGEKVSGWRTFKDGIYCAPLELSGELRNLYVNGYSAVRARSELLYEMREYADNPETLSQKDGFVIYPFMFPESIAEPESLELVFKTWWVSHRVPVDNIIYNEDEIIFLTDSVFYDEVQSTLALKAGKTFYAENALEFLDTPGEFYYSKADKLLYYYPKPGEEISECDIYVPKTEFLIDLSGTETEAVENLSFINLGFKYGAWNDVTDNGIMFTQADKIFDNMDIGNLVPGQFRINYAENITVSDCSFYCLESGAISLTDKVHNADLNGNLIRDISGSGIVIGSVNHTTDSEDAKRCKNISVTNNVITRVGSEYHSTVGISAYYEKGINIVHNTIKETPYSGIHVGWGWLSSANYDFGYYNISDNYVEDVMCTLYDGAHIYTLGPLSGSVIKNNYLKTSGADYGGIYNDTGSCEINIYNNVIEDVVSSWSLWDTEANINAHSNFATVDRCRVDGTVTNYGGITVYDEADRPIGAEKVYASAGVEQKYENLLPLAELPSGEISLIKNTPTQILPWKEYYVPVSSKKEAEILAQYYIDTYHSDGYQNVVNNSGKVYISYNKGEWVTYRINVLEDGIYDFKTLYSYGGQNIASIDVSVDGTTVLSDCKMPALNSWNEWDITTNGEINLTKGKHEITVKVANSGFHMEKFYLNKK